MNRIVTALTGAKRPPSPRPQPVAFEYHQGLHYLYYLARLHLALKPSSYVEIGVSTGASLACAHCPSVGIDPRFHSAGNPLNNRSETHLFQMTSDDYFATHDLSRLFPRGVDLAFIDGLHLFEYALRDFINLERYSHPASLIALHDCCPVNVEMARRDPGTGHRSDKATLDWWTGDVWKLLPILRQYRPHLDLFVLDTPPTGLLIVHGLDRRSTILSEKYDEVIAGFQTGIDADRLGRLKREFPPLDSRDAFNPEALCARLTRPAG